VQLEGGGGSVEVVAAIEDVVVDGEVGDVVRFAPTGEFRAEIEGCVGDAGERIVGDEAIGGFDDGAAAAVVAGEGVGEGEVGAGLVGVNPGGSGIEAYGEGSGDGDGAEVVVVGGVFGDFGGAERMSDTAGGVEAKGGAN